MTHHQGKRIMLEAQAVGGSEPCDVLPMERRAAVSTVAVRKIHAGEKSRESKRRAGDFEQQMGRKQRPHPCTAEIDYTDNEVAFMRGVAHWKTVTGRNFPTLCDILEIAESLGWERRAGWPVEQDPAVAVARHDVAAA